MAKFTKKPLIIDAFKYGNDEAPQWFFDQIGKTVFMPENSCYIVTGRGDQIINIGDYVIKGVHGELYPCGAGIFADTYDAVDQEAPAVGNDHVAEGAQQFTEEEIALNAAPASEGETQEPEEENTVGSAQAANIA